MASFYELMETYPDAVPAARRAIKAKIKEVKARGGRLNDLRELYQNDINRMDFKKQPAYTDWANEHIAGFAEEDEKELRTLEHQLAYLKNMETPVEERRPVARDAVTPERIARAKEYPIRDLVEVKRGSFCLCPFHDDRHPSMHIYKDNHAYCYACSTRADAIDMWMKLQGTTFREAVIAMTP